MITITITYDKQLGVFEWCDYRHEDLTTLENLIRRRIPTSEQKEYMILEKGEENA